MTALFSACKIIKFIAFYECSPLQLALNDLKIALWDLWTVYTATKRQGARATHPTFSENIGSKHCASRISKTGLTFIFHVPHE